MLNQDDNICFVRTRLTVVASEDITLRSLL